MAALTAGMALLGSDRLAIPARGEVECEGILAPDGVLHRGPACLEARIAGQDSRARGENSDMPFCRLLILWRRDPVQ